LKHRLSFKMLADAITQNEKINELGFFKCATAAK
jgi:hypothetical protein